MPPGRPKGSKNKPRPPKAKKPTSALAKKAPVGMQQTVEKLREALSTTETDPLHFLAGVIAGRLFTETITIGEETREVHRRPTIEQRIAASKACINKLYPDLRAQEITTSSQTDIRQLSREELLIVAGKGLDAVEEAKTALLSTPVQRLMQTAKNQGKLAEVDPKESGQEVPTNPAVEDIISRARASQAEEEELGGTTTADIARDRL